ncbi:8225_t:CDS:2, partial [Ambispora gerdemannii]
MQIIQNPTSEPNKYLKPLDIVKVKKTALGNEYYHFGNPEVAKIRPLIPFKYYKKVAEGIAWDEANNFGLRRYCLANNNCEHYVFSRIFGLSYSKQVEERPSKSRDNAHRQGVFDYDSKCYECRQGRINGGESGNFVLNDQLRGMLQGTHNNRSQEIENQYLQEIPPKLECKIM